MQQALTCSVCGEKLYADSGGFFPTAFFKYHGDGSHEVRCYGCNHLPFKPKKGKGWGDGANFLKNYDD